MSLPNLASRPFLNTRPVWLLTLLTTVLTLVLVVVNVRLWGESNRALGEQMRRSEELMLEYRSLERDVRTQVGTLEKVAWRSLASHVEGTNAILREHAFSWVRLLDDIGSVVPIDVRLVKIAPRVGVEGVTVSLSGVARTREAMLALLDNLIRSKVFENPLPQTEDVDPVGYKFSLTVTYLPDGKTQKTEQAPKTPEPQPQAGVPAQPQETPPEQPPGEQKTSEVKP